ncbi:MAG: hypothetical protein WCG92_01875 [Hyphomicrobiales bacterium]
MVRADPAAHPHRARYRRKHARVPQRDFFETSKTLIWPMFLRISALRFVFSRTQKIAIEASAQHRKQWRWVSFTQAKIFFHRCAREGVARWCARSKTSESRAG